MFTTTKCIQDLFASKKGLPFLFLSLMASCDLISSSHYLLRFCSVRYFFKRIIIKYTNPPTKYLLLNSALTKINLQQSMFFAFLPSHIFAHQFRCTHSSLSVNINSFLARFYQVFCSFLFNTLIHFRAYRKYSL